MEIGGKYVFFCFSSLKRYVDRFLPVVDAYQILPRMHMVLCGGPVELGGAGWAFAPPPLTDIDRIR